MSLSEDSQNPESQSSNEAAKRQHRLVSSLTCKSKLTLEFPGSGSCVEVPVSRNCPTPAVIASRFIYKLSVLMMSSFTLALRLLFTRISVIEATVKDMVNLRWWISQSLQTKIEAH